MPGPPPRSIRSAYRSPADRNLFCQCLGYSDGHLGTTERSADGWFGTKVFWYVKPSYRGRALIRGRRLDGPGLLHFDRSRHTDGLPRELHITRHEIGSWTGQPPPGSRGVPSGLSIRASGCYGVQIDGTRFSRVVVFTASAHSETNASSMAAKGSGAD